MSVVAKYVQQPHAYCRTLSAHVTGGYMFTRLLTATLFSFSLAITNNAVAHHAFAANYEMGDTGTVEGVVEEVVWANPMCTTTSR